jgi:hypothetical protein
MKKKDKENKQEQERPDDWEPDWINPANDRKTPYTEDELKEFAQGFMDSMSDTNAVKSLVKEVGKENAEKIVKKNIKKKDKYNLDNLPPNSTKH